MKNTWTYLVISLCFALILLFLFDACKKDDEGNNNGNTPASYLLKITDALEEYLEITFTYNNQNQLIRMDAREDDYKDYITMQYNAHGNVVRIDYYDEDGTLAVYQTFEYNSGKVTKGYEHSGSSAVYDYNYNADGMLESIDVVFAKSVAIISNTTKNYYGLLSSRLVNTGTNKRSINAIIGFQWSNGSVIKESWSSGGTLLESYDYTYDNKVNPYKQFNFPVPLIGGAYAKTISSNNFTKEVWFSVINGDSETTTITYQYNSKGYPISMDDEYHMKYRCD